MSDLVVIVPSRGRPASAVQLAQTFREACTGSTDLVFAVDSDDPMVDAYQEVVQRGLGSVIVADHTSMVDALNRRAIGYANLEEGLRPKAIGFMGDDHRPRTVGWDAAYLSALAERPGFVYGDDLVQRGNLPTQVAISVEVVRVLGHMAPPTLHHLYVDNYWRHLGQAAGCITYLPDVVVEHLHPVAGTAPVDDGYLRVNAPEVYRRDRAAFQAYMAEHGQREVRAVLRAAEVVTR